MSGLSDTARSLACLAAWRTRRQLTAHQAEVLVHVHAASAATAADVCRVMGITTASMARIVAQLVAGGWVVRLRDRDDARRLILQPSKQLVLALAELERELGEERSGPAELGTLLTYDRQV